jgi:hypothetical protein
VLPPAATVTVRDRDGGPPGTGTRMIRDMYCDPIGTLLALTRLGVRSWLLVTASPTLRLLGASTESPAMSDAWPLMGAGRPAGIQVPAATTGLCNGSKHHVLNISFFLTDASPDGRLGPGHSVQHSIYDVGEDHGDQWDGFFNGKVSNVWRRSLQHTICVGTCVDGSYNEGKE